MVIMSGGNLAVYGATKDEGNKGGRAYTIDPMSGNIRSQVSLEEIKDETVLRGQGDSPVIESHTPAIAWDLRKEMLYIVGGEPERVIQVDLGQGEAVRNQAVRYRSPMWERIFHRLFPGAEAKWMTGTFRHAQLSPDGRRLFVTGRKDGVAEDSGGRTQKGEYSGLGVIDLETFEGRRLDLDAEMIQLSSDGRRMPLAGPWSGEGEAKGGAGHGRCGADPGAGQVGIGRQLSTGRFFPRRPARLCDDGKNRQGPRLGNPPLFDREGRSGTADHRTEALIVCQGPPLPLEAAEAVDNSQSPGMGRRF